MNGYFTFEVLPPDNTTRTMVLFYATSSPSVDAVIDAIKSYGRDRPSPDSIILIGLETERNDIESIKDNPKLKDLLPEQTRQVATPSVQLGFIPRNGLNDQHQIGDLRWSSVRAVGLTTIFRRRNALMIAPPTHHFEKPSTRHCDRFIRTANALVDGAEITFIAACCLCFIPPVVRHFYCDTGGINVVAFAIDSLRRRFDSKIAAATVDTFESYEGLKSFTFQHESDSIVLISASTSSSLESEICTRHQRFRYSQLITIFGTGVSPNGANTLLILKEREEIRDSIISLKSYEHEKCPLCLSGSIAVPMMGDQFIPVRSKTKSILPTKKDLPTWLPRILESLAGQSLLRAFYRSPNTLHASKDTFIDLERAFSGEWTSKFLERLERLILQIVPSHTKRVIHLDDEASKWLAEHITKRLSNENTEQIEMIAASSLRDAKQLTDGACLVIAAVVASGQSLLAVSQALRTLQNNRAITYLVAMTRCDHSDQIKKIENDVRMGEFPNDFAFAATERINLPIVGRSAATSWDEELLLLREWANTANGELRVILETRIELLSKAQSDDQRGLSEDLFWPKKNTEKLIGRPGFVFFSERTSADTSQGDFFFTIVSVLHHLRTNGPTPDLRQTEYERRVLSPLCFDRFNDGVIQSSFLRGAIRPELDYSLSPHESQQMTAIIKAVLQNADTDKGEASREFVLALTIGRLVLSRNDLNGLYQDFGTNNGDVVIDRMWEHIAQTHNIIAAENNTFR